MSVRRPCRYGGWAAALAIGFGAMAGGCVPMQAPADAHRSVLPVRLDRAPALPEERDPPLAMWTERRPAPDPVAIHVLRIDLRAPQLEVVAMVAEDPDGDGPAEAVLEDPISLATRHRALAAVNANGFVGLPDPSGKADNRWRPGLPVDIVGVALHEGQWRSGPVPSSKKPLCFWLDGAQRPFFGPIPDNVAGLREGVNAFCFDLVSEGRPLPKQGGDRHPRTAVGVDATGRWLLLVVVDGRQPRVSVGMTACELATFMAQSGCARAINLDGGGSSVMLASRADGSLEIVNRPSDGEPRPVPVLLGVRRRLQASVEVRN